LEATEDVYRPCYRNLNHMNKKSMSKWKNCDRKWFDWLWYIFFISKLLKYKNNFIH